MSFRVMRGVTYRIGGYQGRKVSHQEIQPIDEGVLTLTTAHLYFNGSFQAVSVVLRNVSMVTVGNGLLQVVSGQKVHLFGGLGNLLFKWETYVKALVSNASR